MHHCRKLQDNSAWAPDLQDCVVGRWCQPQAQATLLQACAPLPFLQWGGGPVTSPIFICCFCFLLLFCLLGVLNLACFHFQCGKPTSISCQCQRSDWPSAQYFRQKLILTMKRWSSNWNPIHPRVLASVQKKGRPVDDVTHCPEHHAMHLGRGLPEWMWTCMQDTPAPALCFICYFYYFVFCCVSVYY